MCKLFVKKSEVDLLKGEYRKILKEAAELSKTNRLAGIDKYAEAERILEKIEKLRS